MTCSNIKHYTRYQDEHEVDDFFSIARSIQEHCWHIYVVVVCLYRRLLRKYP